MKTIVDFIDRLAVDKIQKYKGLAIAPLLGTNSSLDYLVLSDALEEGLKIGETGGGSVPELKVDNDTGGDVLMIKGEYIVGGMQNRMIARNIYLAKDFSGKIPVRCVQQGRWHYQEPRHRPHREPRRPRETPMPRRIPEREPEHVPVYRGNKHFLFGGKAALHCAFADSQHDVWGSVSHYLNKAGVHSSTNDLNELYEEKQDEIRRYKKKFSPLERQIGLVAILPGRKKRFVAEIFDKAETLEKYFGTLIESYVIDAIVDKGRADVTQEEVRGFLSSIENSNCRFKERKPVSLGKDVEISMDKVGGNALIHKNVVVYMNLFTKDRDRNRQSHGYSNEHDRNPTHIGPIIPTIHGPMRPMREPPFRHPFSEYYGPIRYWRDRMDIDSHFR